MDSLGVDYFTMTDGEFFIGLGSQSRHRIQLGYGYVEPQRGS